MDLPDKEGSSAASGEKGGRSGLSASSRSARHLLAAEDTHINGSCVSLQWCCHSMFSPLWALGDVKAESASYENRKLVSVIPSLLLGLSSLALCLELSGWDGVRAPVHNLRQHQCACFQLTFACGRRLNSKENTWTPSDSNQRNMSAEYTERSRKHNPEQRSNYVCQPETGIVVV